MCVVVVCAVRAATGGKDPELSRFVIRCLVSGVAHMHSKGALHGDLKPLNASPTHTAAAAAAAAAMATTNTIPFTIR